MSESSRPPWLFHTASVRRRILVAVALAIALTAVALVVMAVAAARVGPEISGPGDAAPASIPTETPLPTQEPLIEPSLPVPAPQERTPPAPLSPPTNVEGEAGIGEPNAQESDASSPGSSAPEIIPPDAPPVAIGQTGPAILSFAASSPVAMCEDEFTATVQLEFRWNTQGATAGWFAPGTVNALLDESSPVDLEAQGVSGVVFDCRKNQEIYALTVSDGVEAVSATSFVVRRLIWPDD